MFLENMKICDEIAFQKGEKKGEQKGILKGRQKGIFEGKLETAKAMLLEGLDISFIMKVTGLSKENIEQLKH